ncbi:MAG: hypothetical protein ABI557_01400 [Aureliella sp.]
MIDYKLWIINRLSPSTIDIVVLGKEATFWVLVTIDRVSYLSRL